MYYIKKVKEFILLELNIWKNYGFKAAWYDFLKNFIFRKNEGIGKRIYKKKYDYIKTLLNDRYVKKFFVDENIKYTNIKQDCTIWMFWWQGINEDTPKTVINCLKTIEKNKGEHKVVVITKDNITEYLKLPKYYYEKLEKGCFTLTHFSDIIRIELLAKYGGIWMDATIMLTKQLPMEMYDLPFYTIKHNLFADWHVCQGKWTGFFIATGENNPFLKYLREMFRMYWKENDFLICYLLIDCFIALGYENNQLFEKFIEDIEISNEKIFFIDEQGNEKYDKTTYENIMNTTNIFKIHYKKHFKEYNEKQELTYYGYIMRNVCLGEEKWQQMEMF